MGPRGVSTLPGFEILRFFEVFRYASTQGQGGRHGRRFSCPAGKRGIAGGVSADLEASIPWTNPSAYNTAIAGTTGAAGPVDGSFTTDWLFTVWISGTVSDVPVVYWLACVTN